MQQQSVSLGDIFCDASVFQVFSYCSLYLFLRRLTTFPDKNYKRENVLECLPVLDIEESLCFRETLADLIFSSRKVLNERKCKLQIYDLKFIYFLEIILYQKSFHSMLVNYSCSYQFQISTYISIFIVNRSLRLSITRQLYSPLFQYTRVHVNFYLKQLLLLNIFTLTSLIGQSCVMNRLLHCIEFYWSLKLKKF